MNNIYILLWFLLVLGAPLSGRCQGTIFFGNREQLDVNAPVTDGRTGQRLEGNAWVAQLYYGKGSVQNDKGLAAAQPIVPFLTGARAGYIALILVSMPGIEPFELAAVQMRVWNAAAGATYEEAAGSPLGVVGASNLILATAGGFGDNPVPLPANMVGLLPFSVFPVPEPKPLELMFFGVAAIWLSVGMFRKSSVVCIMK
jgi:hypothetical protein